MVPHLDKESKPHSGLVEAIRLGIENYRRPGVGRDIDVYAHALLSLERLIEQLEVAHLALVNAEARAAYLQRERDEWKENAEVWNGAEEELAGLKEQLEAARRFPEWCRLVIEQQTAESAVESIGRYLDEPGYSDGKGGSNPASEPEAS